MDGKRAVLIGTLSEWPTISTLPGSSRSASPMRVSSPSKRGSTLAEPEPNMPRLLMRTVTRFGSESTATRPCWISGARNWRSRVARSGRVGRSAGGGGGGGAGGCGGATRWMVGGAPGGSPASRAKRSSVREARAFETQA